MLTPTNVGSLTAVLCGSFRRDANGLQRAFEELKTAGVVVLSPTEPVFVEEVDGFVYAADQVGQSARSIELTHLDAIRAADFVWLHAPDGYVGQSASMEVGFAHAIGVPVFASVAPTDVCISLMVNVVRGIDAVSHALAKRRPEDAAAGIVKLQSYYAKVAAERGYQDEDAQNTLLLLVEEVGELARAVRKSLGLARAEGYADVSMKEELADVQLYLVHLANVLDIDLSSAISDKEHKNATRHAALRSTA